MTQIILEMDAEVMAALRKEPSEMAEEVKTAAVVQWYAEGRISQSKAAQILKIPRTRFLDELFRRKVPAVQVEASELREELEWLKG